MANSEIIYTGQPILRILRGDEQVACAKCGTEIGLLSNAWYGSHQGNKYVCYGCLSPERPAQIDFLQSQTTLLLRPPPD